MPYQLPAIANTQTKRATLHSTRHSPVSGRGLLTLISIFPVILAIFLTLCLSLNSTPSVAKDLNSDGRGKSNAAQDVTHQRHFVIAVGRNSRPYQYAGPNGEAQGMLVDLWRLWAERNQYEVEFKVASWGESVAMIENGSADFHGGMAPTEERKQRFLFGPAIVSIRTNVFVHQQITGAHTLVDLKPFVIGVISGSGHVDSLRKKLSGYNLREYPNREQLYQAAIDGEIQVFAGLERIPTEQPHFETLSRLFPIYKRISDETFHLSYATTIAQSALNQLIGRGLEKILPTELHQIERRWLGGHSDDDAIVIAIPMDQAPYMSVSSKGEPIGLFVDMWRRWAAISGQKIVFLTDSAELSMVNLLEHKADIHAAYADDAVNSHQFAHAYHIYSHFLKVFYPVKEASKELTKVGLANTRLGILANNAERKTVQRQFPGIELVSFNNIESMIEASLQQQIDGFVAAQELFNVYVIQQNQQTRFAEVENVSFESKMYTLVANDNKALIATIKDGFSRIPVSELMAMENAWIKHSDSLYFSNVQQKVHLNPAEKNWLLRHPVIRLGALRDLAPIEFVDDKGKLVGVTADFVDLIEQRAKIGIEVFIYDEWSQMLTALKNKNIDMIANIEATQDRRSYANFSEGYWPTHWALVTAPNSQSINSLSQLKGRRLAVVKGYQLISVINQQYPQILLQIVPDIKSGFAAVTQGEADAFIDGMVTLASELKSGDYPGLNFALAEDIAPAQESFAVRHDWQPLVGILNKVIVNITEAEKKQILENWFEIKLASGVDKVKVIQFGVGALLIIVVVLIWNRQLQRQIRYRKAMELKMKHMATHDELTGLPNRGLLRDRLNTAIHGHARHQELIALLFIDLDGFKAVNDTHGHDAGDELLIQISDRFNSAIRKADTCARCGGDEFVIVLTSLHHCDQIANVCEKLLATIKHPFVLSNCTANVGASIGVAVYPYDGIDDEALLKQGDMLMYQVKTAGKNSYRFSDTVLALQQSAALKPDSPAHGGFSG